MTARLSPYLSDQLSNWASEFPEADEARAFPPEAVRHAPALLEAFLKGACMRAGGELEGIRDLHLRAALLEDLPPVPEGVRPHVPGMVRAFLARLEAAGRLGGGQAAIAAAEPAWRSRASGKAVPQKRVGEKIGRNDPCPCGSGRKFKKCCGLDR